MKLSVDSEMRRARHHAKRGESAQAAEIYGAVLQAFPKNKRAQQELVKLRVVPTQQTLPKDAYNRISATFRQGDYAGVIRDGGLLATQYPDDFILQFMLAAANTELNRLEEAVTHYSRGLALNPNYAEGHYNLGNVHEKRGAIDEAIASYTRALRLKPDYPHAHYNLGVVLQGRGLLGEAKASYKRALASRPDYPEAHHNLGSTLQSEGALEEAIIHYQRAVAGKPDYAEAHYSLGVVFRHTGQLEEAAESCKRAIAINPDQAEAHNNLGVISQEMSDLKAAEASYNRAVEINPDYAEAHNNLGAVRKDMGVLDASVTSYNRALEINPDYTEAHNNLGLVLKEAGDLEAAVASYSKALEIDPDYANARAQKLHDNAHMCRWEAMREDASRIPGLGIEGKSIAPFVMLVADDNPRRNRQRAEKYARGMIRSAVMPTPQSPATRPQRLRVGYFSADFHNHATMYLMASLFALHDRNGFEIHAYSFGPDKDDDMRQQLVASVDRFHDVRHMSDAAITRLARADDIDIAVDLKGFTQHSRPGIFAGRAAPIQISYLGYPGTLGAPFMDYMIADDQVIPESQQQFYSEKIIFLPNSYQVNDNKRRISNRIPIRAECGLPEDAFVFCCFNVPYKIGPDEFDIWMRLLREVEGSVLWLFKTNPWAETNLRAEAEARNIDGSRIIFAERLPQEDHLARLGLADLFLDTFVCNAHTTASDALWAGVPLITKPGEGFAARVAASLLHAIELPELIADSKDHYEALALEFANDRQKLQDLKQKLAHKRTSAPLFDTPSFVRHIEDGYQQAFQRYLDGQAPAPIKVASTAQDDAAKDEIRLLLELFNQGKFAETVGDAERLVQENPGNHLLQDFLGTIYFGLMQLDKAVIQHQRAIEIDPRHAPAHYNLARALEKKGVLDGAVASYRQAIEIRPNYVNALYNLGLILQASDRRDDAIALYRRTLEIDPDHARAREQILRQLALMCDWTAIETEAANIPNLGIEGSSVSPFSLLAMEDAPERHRQRAERTATELYTAKPLPAVPCPQHRPDRLRIGYFSADFHDHATMYLMAGLFEAHDREAYEILAYSYGPDKQDTMRQRLVGAVDAFHDVRDLSDESAAHLAREHRIDIAVDLKGYTQHSRVGILSYRPAPVQMSYLGYPGTLGAPFIDYLIADDMVIPTAQQQHYSETIIRLPHSYQVNDQSREISDRPMTRAEVGLPDDAFVFCCFNSNYKIGTCEFDIWMRLLNSIEGSVLWLFKSNHRAEDNLRNHAKSRGIAPERIIFAGHLPLSEHLARYRFADLFLDTFIYNAHTTGSDALWTGLPVVTKLGQGFASRVGGSLLNAVGLPELITQTPDDYETLAFELASDPEKLGEIKRKLTSNRSTEPLFDTSLFTRHIEEAYKQAYQNYFDGSDPKPIKIGP